MGAPGDFFGAGSLAFPPALHDAVQHLAEGEARRGLAARSVAISAGYRSRNTSASAVTASADVGAYALSRMPATYTATETVLARLASRMPAFAPASLLDLGCGPGTASWAAVEAFPSIGQVTMLDSNLHFLAAAREIAAAHPVLTTATIAAGNILTPPAGPFDLVVAGYALTELADPAAAIERIWSACSGALLIVEPGTPRDYRRLMAMRGRLIGLGATIAAPCPHDARCPLTGDDWCHFSVRLPRSRDHMRLKGGTLGYEDEKFSYLVACRQKSMAFARPSVVLAPPIRSKFDVKLKLCTSDGVAWRAVAKRDPEYRSARKIDWGSEL